MSNQEYKQFDRHSRKVGGRVLIWAIIITLVVGGFSIAHWGFDVFTSDVKGRGDAEKRINSADNRIKQQEEFQKRYNDIIAADDNINTAATRLKLDPKDKAAQIDFAGTIQYCNRVVAEYNSKVKEVSAERFRDTSLPYEINLNPALGIVNTEYDCKEDITQ